LEVISKESVPCLILSDSCSALGIASAPSTEIGLQCFWRGIAMTGSVEIPNYIIVETFTKGLSKMTRKETCSYLMR
jgi:hypothetical protein